MIRFGEQYDGLVVVDNVVVLALLLGDTQWYEGCLAAGLDGCHMVGPTVSVAGIVLVVCGLGDRFAGEDMWRSFLGDESWAICDGLWLWDVGEVLDGVSACWDHPRRWYRVILLDDWHPRRSGLGWCFCGACSIRIGTLGGWTGGVRTTSGRSLPWGDLSEDFGKLLDCFGRLRRAWVRSWAARVAASVNDIWGIRIV
eukprot:scaffold61947_cov63-Attheya_sp.AAC.4